MYNIPVEWLNDPKNACKVREILERNLHSNLHPMKEHAIIELKNIHETLVIEKLESGALKNI